MTFAYNGDTPALRNVTVSLPVGKYSGSSRSAHGDGEGSDASQVACLHAGSIQCVARIGQTVGCTAVSLGCIPHDSVRDWRTMRL